MSHVQFVGADGSEPADVRLNRASSDRPFSYAVRVRDRAVDVEIDASGDYGGQIRSGGKVTSFRVCRCADGVDVWLDGHVYSLKVADRTAHRAGAAGAVGVAGDLLAPMPGTILKVNVSAGAAFEAHEPLIVMESMKMEMSVSSPRPGRVGEVLCGVGDLVELGATLVKLEEA